MAGNIILKNFDLINIRLSQNLRNEIKFYLFLQVPVKQAGNHESLKKYLDSSLHFKSDSNENRGFLLLDHHWQKNMGDFKFDNVSFPNIEETLQMIK